MPFLGTLWRSCARCSDEPRPSSFTCMLGRTIMPATDPIDATAPRPWTPNSWRDCPLRQIRGDAERAKLEAMESRLNKCPPLIFVGEARRLKAQLALAAERKAFVLQGGDCAESFSDFTASAIRATFRVLMQMA